MPSSLLRKFPACEFVEKWKTSLKKLKALIVFAIFKVENWSVKTFHQANKEHKKSKRKLPIGRQLLDILGLLI